jgi:lipoprotein-anchoring transpeptidase ErfK/SrfK
MVRSPSRRVFGVCTSARRVPRRAIDRMYLHRLGIRLLLAVLTLLCCGERLAAAPPEENAQADTSTQVSRINSTLELQVELHRRGFSCGSIDGVLGLQTAAALSAFQRGAGIAETGLLDEPTQEHLQLSAPALGSYTFTALELAGLHPEAKTWLEKSQMPALGYSSALEMVAERFHSHPNLIRKLNPGIDWDAVLPGTKIVVPAVEQVVVTGTATQIVITLDSHELEVFDAVGRVIAHFPVSIARMVEKRPVGSLHVTVVIPNPDYTFDPDLFPESAEGRELGRKLVVPPGPNNPVGLAWIGLDRQGYGIHGTPDPENVGRTESHGCFRLANWDVLTLVGLVAVGMPVSVM